MLYFGLFVNIVVLKSENKRKKRKKCYQTKPMYQTLVESSNGYIQGARSFKITNNFPKESFRVKEQEFHLNTS
jgi:hypothetical protein